MSLIYLRDEYIFNEYRTPLTPLNIKKLINSGFIFNYPDLISALTNILK